MFSRDLNEMYRNRVDFRVGGLQTSCPIFHGTALWDSGLTKVGLLVHMVELMQGLGRRRTCLRGCVTEGQVECTNLLPYLL